MKIVTRTRYGLMFLLNAKEYAQMIGKKDKLNQAIKIIIFSITAAEAIANFEASEYLGNSMLKKFVQTGFRPKGNRQSKIFHKWIFLLEKVEVSQSKRENHLANLDEWIFIRNRLIHFDPYRHRKEKILQPKKYKIPGPGGKLYTSFKKIPMKTLKYGELHEINLTKARKCFHNIDSMIYDYFDAKNLWPPPSWANKHYGRRSPFKRKGGAWSVHMG